MSDRRAEPGPAKGASAEAAGEALRRASGARRLSWPVAILVIVALSAALWLAVAGMTAWFIG